jgi:dUTP pyrophosphatase
MNNDQLTPPDFPLQPKAFSLEVKDALAKVEVRLVVMEHNSYGVPRYGSPGASGFDLQACISEGILLHPSSVTAVSAGIMVEIPRGYELQIRSRSGLTLQGLVVANSPGTIDSDYRGEIKVILTNIIDIPFMINPGMKIAQAVLCPIAHCDFTLCSKSELTSTARGQGGFGSTGV